MENVKMSEKQKQCPMCPRGCDLSAPHCGRGEEYARTGKAVDIHEHGRSGKERLHFEKKEQQLIMKYLHHAVNAVDRGSFTQDDIPMMFSTLTDEETIQLASLLEKLSDDWMGKAPQKPKHHGRG